MKVQPVLKIDIIIELGVPVFHLFTLFGTSLTCHYMTQVGHVTISHKLDMPLYHTSWTCHYITQVGHVTISHKLDMSLYHTSWTWTDHYMTQVGHVTI